jgi:hypothetical protein
MVSKRMLQNELDKNGLDKEIANIELENAKKRFAEDMIGVDYRTLATKPVKHKIPRKFKMKEKRERMWKRIKIFLGL